MKPSRREILTGAVAAVAGLSACDATRPTFGGRIVGANAERGHLLRGGALPPVESREDVPVVIVGGGAAGLSAAWKLARSGLGDFVVLEGADQAGGTSVAGRNQVSAYPWGAHYVPVPTRQQRTLCQLLEELGVISGFDSLGRAVAGEQHLCRAPQERLFYRGTWTQGLYLHDGASPDDLRQLEEFERTTRALAARRDQQGRRAFAIPLANSSRDPDLMALDRVSMGDWMSARGFTSERLRWYVEYACRDDFGALLHQTSAWAALHYFCSRTAGSEQESAEFLTWPEGNAFLVRHLASTAGDRVRSGCLVTAVDSDGDRNRVTYVDTTAGVSRQITAEQVICAVPRFLARKLIPALRDERGSLAYGPWVVANLTLRTEPASRGFPTCWDNVLFDSDSLGYVVATHQSDRRDRDTVWTWYRPLCGDDPAVDRARLLQPPWGGFRDMVLKDLVRAHPDLERHLLNLDVWRWGHAMIRPTPGFIWGPARQAAARPLGSIHFAGTDVGGLPIFEEAQWTGVRAAEEVLSARDVPFESSL